MFEVARKSTRKLTVPAFLFACLSMGLNASAQENEGGGESSQDELQAQEELQESLVVAAPEQAEDEEKEIEEIVVTGSRLKRTTFSSISPLQVISGQISREVGLIDATEILQSSSAAAGQQVDLTFSGFVLDDGPGSTSVDLRGLGASRTLTLINGRRVAPAGVEGAPGTPNLEFIPSSLIDHYDVLLDGASSIYGSDAIAGVVNAVLRKDFDGFEVEVFSNISDHGAGDDNTARVTWGKNWDRGFVGVGLEYNKALPTTWDDLPWTRGCDRNHEITESGEIRSQGVFYDTVYGMDVDDCRVSNRLAGRVVVPFAGSIYYTPGYSNGGWPNFSESSLLGATGVDGNGDGDTDVNFRDYDLNGREQDSHLFGDREGYSFMAYGEYTFEGDTNFTPYFEAIFSTGEFFYKGDNSFFFPDVPANNPFNICNPGAQGGVDCIDAWNTLVSNPHFRQQVMNRFGCDLLANCVRSGSLLRNATGAALEATPIVVVTGDRRSVDVEVDLFRLVVGFEMDLPFLNVGPLNNWSLDTSVVYSRSEGEAHRPGIREDRLDLALGAYSSTNTPCENDSGGELPAADTAPGCVPVNLFAPSLYQDLIGDFATPEERNYLFDSRDFDTEYVQTIFSANATGTLFSMPAGGVGASFGLEYRNDDIKSIPDQVARDGLTWGYFSDGGADGDKDTKEAYAEIELPLLGNVKFADELVLNASWRWTEDELYGAETTSSLKLGYRPVSSLLLRGTWGTSFRAPNLREVFLRSQTGFLNVFDPCFVPEDAFDGLTNTYIPENDDRDSLVLENCRAQGVDPTRAFNNGLNTYSVEVAAGGSSTLKAEESEAYSVGFAWEQPFTNAFSFSIGVTYYEIDIENTIIEPNPGFIVYDCYNSTTGNSAFCSRITREDDPDQPFLTLLDIGFINQNEEKARGIDVNMVFDDTVTIFGRPVELAAELNANHPKSRTTLFVDNEGNRNFNQFAGEWGFPSWRGTLRVRAEWNDWRLTWSTRYVGSVHQDAAEVDAFEDAISGISDTCYGPPNDELCRDYADADSYKEHAVSLYYLGDGWLAGFGIRNVFDEEPPRWDSSQLLSDVNGAPLGFGYDLDGRVYYLNLVYEFGTEG